MTTTYAPTTELEAVNVMLGVIGEAPVSSLDTSGFSEVAVAVQILHESSREIQSEEWDCNAEYDYTLPLDTDGFITVPSNVLRIDLIPDFAYSYNPVIRGNRLYDKLNHTYVFDKELRFDVIWFLPFTDLPEPLRRYITISAARKFQKRFYSSEAIDSFTAEDEMKARTLALQSDSSTADYNMTQNYSVYNILTR